jgi:hypothetical protein
VGFPWPLILILLTPRCPADISRLVVAVIVWEAVNGVQVTRFRLRPYGCKEFFKVLEAELDAASTVPRP